MAPTNATRPPPATAIASENACLSTVVSVILIPRLLVRFCCGTSFIAFAAFYEVAFWLLAILDADQQPCESTRRVVAIS
jgi:hypothetical protein